MAREDDEAAIDAALRHMSPAPPAEPVPTGLEQGPARPRAPQSLAGYDPDAPVGCDGAPESAAPPAASADIVLPVAESSSMSSTAEPGSSELASGVHDAQLDLEGQRRERVERLRAAEEAPEPKGPEVPEPEPLRPLESDPPAALAGGDEATEERAPNLEGQVMPDGLEGLRRRRPEGAAHPPDSTIPADMPPAPTPADSTPSAPVDPAIAGLKREAREARSGTATPAGEEKQCRICFGGREEEAELGRLISPCLCAGSMRYVHVKCINRWRGTGANAKSFMECPQCQHQYAIRRTLVSGLATSQPILYLVTTVLFLLLTFFSGHFLLRYLVAAAEVAAEETVADSGGGGGGGGSMTRHGDVWENDAGTVIIAAPGLTLVYDIVVEAVDIFLDLAAAAYERWPRDGTTFHSRASRLTLAAVIRLILGLSVLGSLSFLSLLASLSLFAPLQLVYQLLGTGVFRGPLEGLRRRAPNLGALVVVLAVAIGVANSLVSVYDVIRAAARKLLSYVETQILEVNPEDARLAREAAARQPHWASTWVAERRWRRLGGWYEVWVRLWEWMKEAGHAAVAYIKASVEARVQAAGLGREAQDVRVD